MKRKYNFIRTTFFVSVAVLLSVATLNGCDKEETTDPTHQIEKVSIEPKSASMAVGAEEDFSAYVLTSMGDTLNPEDLDLEWRWWSSDTTVFDVTEDGIATGKSEGDAYCIIEAKINLKSAALLYTGRDSAFVSIF